jgi:hypothetical protein
MNIVPDELLRPAILILLQSGSGISCDLGLLVRISRLETGRYWLTSDSCREPMWGQEYETAEEAVDKFLTLRHERRLGLDYRPWQMVDG